MLVFSFSFLKVRLKARARQLEAADENELGQILSIAT